MEKYEQKDSNEQQAVISPEELKKSLTLSDFIKGFNEKFKENITESTVRAMKHAIEVNILTT